MAATSTRSAVFAAPSATSSARGPTRQLTTCPLPARVGKRQPVGGQHGMSVSGVPRQLLAVRCQAFPSLTKQAAAKADVEDWVATVQVLKEGAFDVASHALSDLLGQKLKMFLVSSEIDPETKKPKMSPEADVDFNKKYSKDVGKDSWIKVLFPKVPKDFGKPGALLVESYHDNEFFLKSLTIETGSPVQFPCHSWITHCSHNSNRPRVFFANQALLPKDTPEALKKLRGEDLSLLRGNGTGQRTNPERIYDYDVYNDLGSPDKDITHARPTLGGSSELPYPRRCRTGRKRCVSVPDAEEPVFFNDGYVPRDERFSPWKMALFIQAAIKSFGQEILPTLRDLVDYGDHYEAFNEIHELYEGSLRSVKTIKQMFKNPISGSAVQFPPPGVVQASKDAWLHDVEFGRQRLAGSNPLVIELLKEFPPTSKLDPKEYGSQKSTITHKDLEVYMEGLTVEEAIKSKRMYILDYHDCIMPYVKRINEDTKGKIYASRTLFFLTRRNVLVPIVIELSLPPTQRGQRGSSRVFRAPPPGITMWTWRLAKAHVATVDSGVHQLVSHWLRTHACVEPFIIATHRQLSMMHPLHVLLHPHFKDTMNINSMARTSLIDSLGIIENGFTPGKYCLEISSVFYKSWRFDEQALPNDLLKRGMAVPDPTSKHGVKLVLEDYPFAKDGLDLWGAIKDWVSDYVGIYYKSDADVEGDAELQGWWKEITELGHGDHKGAKWWGEMKKVEELVQALTTIMWVTSGHHSAVNFGQYAYSGFMPNSPTICQKLIPEQDTAKFETFLSDPEKYYLSMVPSQGQATLIMATVEILAQHLEDEQYLGQRSDPQWTSDPRALEAFEKFSATLSQVENEVQKRNMQATGPLFHRAGPALLPYTLLSPLPGGVGLTFRGVPNSISI
ncbi:hypothetical protein GOP47_0001537 [Adiantum capillus-veneris]|uniref:Lipoxygenase n=1 Tax=Adiantum capillus-veneris TaxID=13818 RepID=A0A9D4V8J6_ADICA|nr:hypothetical protein GOP47_0001537 [Adiantum capillus-veneris]